jgi:hypothetical protein
MRTRHTALVFTTVLSAMGYIGAALFYGYLLGFNTQTPLTCPVCPNITSVGEPLEKFVVRTLFFGTFNAFVLVSIGWCVRGLITVAKKSIRSKAI